MKRTALCSPGAPSDHSDVARKRQKRGHRPSEEKPGEKQGGGVRVSAEVFLTSPIGEVTTPSHALHFTGCRALSSSQSRGMVVIVYI